MKKTVENRNSFDLDIGLTNTGCTAQLTIPILRNATQTAVNAPGNFFLIIAYTAINIGINHFTCSTSKQTAFDSFSQIILITPG